MYNTNITIFLIFVTVNGGAGNIEDLTPSTAETGNKTWVAYIDTTSTGYGTATVHNDTALTWRYYRSSDSVLLDEITFFRSRKSAAAATIPNQTGAKPPTTTAASTTAPITITTSTCASS